MDDYFKAKKEVERQKSLLNNRLTKVLEKNGYDSCFAWFNWNEDKVIIVWNNTKLPRELFFDLEKEFGEIEYVKNPRNPIGDKVLIVFKEEMFR